MIENKIYDVTTLNNYIKNLFEGDLLLSRIYIKGEISNLNKHSTGHYYFTLKDQNSKVSCMMFSTYVNRLKKEINNGDEVLIFGKVSVYDKLGTYQIYVYNIEPFGQGKYLLELEELKKRLYSEGIFNKPKKKINQYPKKIAVITSSTGAAIQDIKHAISLRWPCIINVYPCLVQGIEAPKSIISQLRKADSSDADTLILARGGGANEDLKAFNDEGVVRCCYGLKKPLISAIGHQIDNSLVDLVSDLNCITPTDAGVNSCINKQELFYQIDSLVTNASGLVENLIHTRENNLLQLISIIEKNNPTYYLNKMRQDLNNIVNSSNYLIDRRLTSLSNSISLISEKLVVLNPNKIFEKGYSLVYQNGKLLNSINFIKKSDDLEIKMKDGTLLVQVKEIKKYGK